MALRPSRIPLVLALDDRGGRLWGEDGGPLPEASPEARTSVWAEELRKRAPRGGEICLVLGQSSLNVTCQEAPFLNRREVRDAARRIGAADPGGANGNYAGALDSDSDAAGGHQLWVASHPAQEMQAWSRLVQAAGLELAFAAPWPRLLLRGLEGLPDLPRERVVLAVEPGLGRLCFFRGRALLLLRSFRLPEGDDEALYELVIEEVSRAIQFFKQKHRGLGFEHLLTVGLAELPEAMLSRLQGGLRLKVQVLPDALESILLQGLRRERESKGGLNLVPEEILEARRRRVSRGVVWASAVVMLALFAGVGLIQSVYEGHMKEEVVRAQEALDRRKAAEAERVQVVDARLPLLRLRLAERRQKDASEALGRIGLQLMKTPAGIHLEKVEIFQAPGEGLSHTFSVSGTAITGPAFSAGPLAEYLQVLQRTPGFTLAPLKEVSISDLQADVKGTPVARAVTHFSLEGSVR